MLHSDARVTLPGVKATQPVVLFSFGILNLISAVLFSNQESNKLTTSEARYVVGEYAAVETSLCDLEKASKLAHRWRAFEVRGAVKGVSGGSMVGNCGEEQLEVIPSKFSSQSVAVIDTQTCIDGTVPATLAELLGLSLVSLCIQRAVRKS